MTQCNFKLTALCHGNNQCTRPNGHDGNHEINSLTTCHGDRFYAEKERSGPGAGDWSMILWDFDTLQEGIETVEFVCSNHPTVLPQHYRICHHGEILHTWQTLETVHAQ